MAEPTNGREIPILVNKSTQAIILSKSLADRIDWCEACRYGKDFGGDSLREKFKTEVLKRLDENSEDVRGASPEGTTPFKEFLEAMDYKVSLQSGSDSEANIYSKDKVELSFFSLDEPTAFLQRCCTGQKPFVFVQPEACHASGLNLNNAGREDEGNEDSEEPYKQIICDYLGNHKLHKNLYETDTAETGARKTHLQSSISVIKEKVGDAGSHVPVFPLSSAIDILRWYTFHRTYMDKFPEKVPLNPEAWGNGEKARRDAYLDGSLSGGVK